MPPTQVARPWRATLRTVVQVLIGLALLAPIAAQTAGIDLTTAPRWLAAALAACAAVTRVMALPQVEAFLARFAPWLAADPQRVNPQQR